MKKRFFFLLLSYLGLHKKEIITIGDGGYVRMQYIYSAGTVIVFTLMLKMFKKVN